MAQGDMANHLVAVDGDKARPVEPSSNQVGGSRPRICSRGGGGAEAAGRSPLPPEEPGPLVCEQT
jgi:hypothetical protein